MKIYDIAMTKEINGIKPFSFSELGDVVLLTGSNGSGKTRLLKLIQNHIVSLQDTKTEYVADTGIRLTLEDEIELTRETANNIRIIDYSHYDAVLQSPKDFSSYVIHRAKDVLKTCNYEETALNSLLLIEDLARGYSEEFRDGKAFERFQQLAQQFGIDIKYNRRRGQLTIFGQSYDDLRLSPGQIYLLRMLVAYYQNEDDSGSLVFFLDEPELHLHPGALIEMLERLRAKFKRTQFWISTHALSLISYYLVINEKSTILYMKDGVAKQFRSDSSFLLDGLIGNDDNLYAMQQLFAWSDQYACNQFTFECFLDPKTLRRGKFNRKKDPQAELITKEDLHQKKIVDYGVGKGRFLEEWALCLEYENKELKAPKYYAYDPSKDDAITCKSVMNKYAVSADNYFNDMDSLETAIGGTADYVLLVNVLHEIPPEDWCIVFAHICRLLGPDGKLILVERDELTVGETAHDYGFLMLTSNAAMILFGGEDYVTVDTYPGKKHIVKYIVKKAGLYVDEERVQHCIETIHEDVWEKIAELRSTPRPENRHDQYKKGSEMAFLLNQYANTSLWKRAQEKNKENGRMPVNGGKNENMCRD